MDRKWLLGLVVAGGVGGIAALGLVVLLSSEERHHGPSPVNAARPDAKANGIPANDEPAKPVEKPVPPVAKATEWNHKDLLAHFRSKGIAVQTAQPGPMQTRLPALLFVSQSREVDRIFGFGLEYQPARGKAWEGCALVEVYPTERQAKDEEGTSGDIAFSWKRFLFTGDPKWIAKLQAALPKD